MSDVEFLNIDLDLESENDLTLLIKELGDSVVIMNKESVVNSHKVSLELAGLEGNPEYIFNKYFSLLNNLSAEAKKLWDSCFKREFDLGFECEGAGSLQERLSGNAIDTLSKLKASCVITIYKD